MAESLTGQYQMPAISILDMILSGPKPYFARRGQMSDDVWMKNQEMAMRGQFAQGLLDRPEFNAAMDNPYDRRANFGLWATTQGGPESIANQGANWLQTSLQAIYGREGETFADALAKSRTRYSTDEALRLERGKLDIANQQMTTLLNSILQRDPQTGQTGVQTPVQRDAAWNLLAKNGLVPAAPEGYSVTTNPDGQMTFQPTIGTKAWQDSMKALSPLQAMHSSVAELQAMFDGQATFDTGRAQQLIQMTQDMIRKGLEMGSLDAGTAAAMEKYLPQISSMAKYQPGSGYWLTGREKLRGLSIDVERKLGDWSRTYQIQLDDPRVGNPYAFKAGPTKPAPTGSADAAVVRNRQSEPAAQPKAPRTNRAGGPIEEDTGSSLMDIFGAQGGRTRAGR